MALSCLEMPKRQFEVCLAEKGDEGEENEGDGVVRLVYGSIQEMWKRRQIELTWFKERKKEEEKEGEEGEGEADECIIPDLGAFTRMTKSFFVLEAHLQSLLEDARRSDENSPGLAFLKKRISDSLELSKNEKETDTVLELRLDSYTEWLRQDAILLEALQDEDGDTLKLRVQFVERDTYLYDVPAANSDIAPIPRFLMALDCSVEEYGDQYPSVTGWPFVDAIAAFGFEPNDDFGVYFDGVRLGEDFSFSQVMEMGYLRLDSDWGSPDAGRRPVVDVVPLPFDENLAIVRVELKAFSASARCCVMVPRDVDVQAFLDTVWNKFGLLESPCPFDETVLPSRCLVTTAFLADFLKPVSPDPLELILLCDNVKLHCVPVGDQKGKREFDLLVSVLIETSDLKDRIVETTDDVSPEQLTFVSGSTRVELTNDAPLRSLKRAQFEDSMRCGAFRIEVGIPFVEIRLCTLDSRGIDDQKIRVVDGTQVVKLRQEPFLSHCSSFLIHQNGEMLEDEDLLHGGMALFCVAPPFIIDTQSRFSISSEASPEELRQRIEEQSVLSCTAKSFPFVRPQGRTPYFLDRSPAEFLHAASEYIVDVHLPDDPLVVFFRDESQTHKPGICVPSEISTSDLRALWKNAFSRPVLVYNGIELTKERTLLSAVVSTSSSVEFRRVVVDLAVPRRGAPLSFSHAFSRITLKGVTDCGESIVRDLVVQREVTLEEFFRRVNVLIPEIEDHAIRLCSCGSELTPGQLSELLSRDGEVVEFSSNCFPENVVLCVHFFPEDSYSSSSILRVFSVPFDISTPDLKHEFLKGFGQFVNEDDEVNIRFMVSESVTNARPLKVVLGHCMQTQRGLDLSGILDFECSPLPETALQQASMETDPLIPVTVKYFGAPKSLSTVVHILATFRKSRENEEEEEEEEEEEGEVVSESAPALIRQFDVVEAIETELLLWIVSEKFDDDAVKPWKTFLEVVTDTGCVRLLTELTLANVLTKYPIQSRDVIQLRVVSRSCEPIEEPFAATVPVFVSSSSSREDSTSHNCQAEFDVCELISTADLKRRVAQELDVGPSPEEMRLHHQKTNLTSEFSLADLIDSAPFIRTRVGLSAIKGKGSIPRPSGKDFRLSCSQESVQGGWGGTTGLFLPFGERLTTGLIHRTVTELLFMPNGIRFEVFFDGILLEIDADFGSIRRMCLDKRHMIDMIEVPFVQPHWVLISVEMYVAGSRTGRCILVDPALPQPALVAEIVSGMTELEEFLFLEEFSVTTKDGTILTDEFTLQDALHKTPPPSKFVPFPLTLVYSRVNLLFPDFETGISVRPDIPTSELQVLVRDRLWLEYSPRLIISNALLSAEATLNDLIRDRPEIEIFGDEKKQLRVTVCRECRLLLITASFHIGSASCVEEETPLQTKKEKTGLFAVDVECPLADLKSAVCHRFFPKEVHSDFDPEEYFREKRIRIFHNHEELSPLASLKKIPVENELDQIPLVVEEDFFVFIRYCHPQEGLRLGTMSSSSRIPIRDLKLEIAERFGLSITAIHADGGVLADSCSLGDALRDRSGINIAVCCAASVELGHRKTFVVPQTITPSELIDRVHSSPDALHLITQDSETFVAPEDSEMTWKPMPIEIAVHSFAQRRIEVRFRDETGFYRTKFLRPDITTADLSSLAIRPSQHQRTRDLARLTTFFVFQGHLRLTEDGSLLHFLRRDVSLCDRPLVLDVGFTDKDFADVFAEVRVEGSDEMPRTLFVQKTLHFSEFRKRLEELFIDTTARFPDMKIMHYGAELTQLSLDALLHQKEKRIDLQLVPRQIPIDLDIEVRYICETFDTDVYRNFTVPLRISDVELRMRITKFFPDDLRRDLLVLTFEHTPAARLSESYTLREAVLRAYQSEDELLTCGEVTLYLSRIPEKDFSVLLPSQSELVGKHAEILWDFNSEGADEMSVSEGEVVVIREEAGEWMLVEKPSARRGVPMSGYVPTTYVGKPVTKAIRVIAKRGYDTASFEFDQHGTLEDLQKKIASSPIVDDVIAEFPQNLFLVMVGSWTSVLPGGGTTTTRRLGPAPCQDPPLADVVQGKHDGFLQIAVYFRPEVLYAVARLVLGESKPLPSWRRNPTTTTNRMMDEDDAISVEDEDQRQHDDEDDEEEGENDADSNADDSSTPIIKKRMTLEFWFERREDIFARIEEEFGGRVVHDRIRLTVDGVEIRCCSKHAEDVEEEEGEANQKDSSLLRPTLFDITSGYAPFRSVGIEIEQIEGRQGGERDDLVSVVPILVQVANEDGFDSRDLSVPLAIDVDHLRLQICDEFGFSTAQREDMILYVESQEVTSDVPLSALISKENMMTIVSVGFVAPISWITVGLSGRVVRVPLCISTRQLKDALLLGPRMRLFLHVIELTDSCTLAVALETDPSAVPDHGHLLSLDSRAEKLALRICVGESWPTDTTSSSDEDMNLSFKSSWLIRVPFNISHMDLREAIREVASLSQDSVFAILVNGRDPLEPCMRIGELLESLTKDSSGGYENSSPVNILVTLNNSSEEEEEEDTEREEERSVVDVSPENDDMLLQERGAALQLLIRQREQEITELTTEDARYEDEIRTLESRLLLDDRRDEMIKREELEDRIRCVIEKTEKEVEEEEEEGENPETNGDSETLSDDLMTIVSTEIRDIVVFQGPVAEEESELLSDEEKRMEQS